MAVYDKNGNEVDWTNPEERKKFIDSIFDKQKKKSPKKDLPYEDSPMFQRWDAENEDIADTGQL